MAASWRRREEEEKKRREMCFHPWGSGADDGRCWCQAAATQTDRWGEEVVCWCVMMFRQNLSSCWICRYLVWKIWVIVLWNKKLAEEEEGEEESPACRRRDQWQVFFSGVCVASDTFIETKEAPVAVLSVAANSRVWRRRTNHEMFSLSLVLLSEI